MGTSKFEFELETSSLMEGRFLYLSTKDRYVRNAIEYDINSSTSEFVTNYLITKSRC